MAELFDTPIDARFADDEDEDCKDCADDGFAGVAADNQVGASQNPIQPKPGALELAEMYKHDPVFSSAQIAAAGRKPSTLDRAEMYKYDPVFSREQIAAVTEEGHRLGESYVTEAAATVLGYHLGQALGATVGPAVGTLVKQISATGEKKK